MRDLVKRLNELCDAAPFQASWYLKDFATGASADRRGDVPVPSASTRKISIMMAALAAVALDFGDGDSLDAKPAKRFTDFLQLERLKDRNDILHATALWLVMMRCNTRSVPTGLF